MHVFAITSQIDAPVASFPQWYPTQKSCTWKQSMIMNKFFSKLNIFEYFSCNKHVFYDWCIHTFTSLNSSMVFDPSEWTVSFNLFMYPFIILQSKGQDILLECIGCVLGAPQAKRRESGWLTRFSVCVSLSCNCTRT